ncbi:peptidase, M23 family [Bifidobacterium sp. DSM 109958]|uniref:Peptidase, M23 family n=1 Tax=Bifidobacterium moraviense TaxID=2675323 RepID=A0A7Y0HYY4_9BIFI|nr:peptidoglycan DD-metalloendopeptidase family protein [Bifidobacterium sp. DSM 109958]NMM99827.1 peptidase, M23 family [Bifidobacterium sp. DSM 109958]
MWRAMLCLGSALCLLLAVARAPYALATGDAAADEGCRAALSWPVGDGNVAPTIVRGFDAPEQPWLAGHRGVDLATAPGETLNAPADGVISFAGLVAGKQVVSIRHGPRLTTFEPAVGTLAVGASVTRGQPFAVVGESGDHCDGSCLHWGVREGERDYRDPAALAGTHRIRLRPVREPPE